MKFFSAYIESINSRNNCIFFSFHHANNLVSFKGLERIWKSHSNDVKLGRIDLVARPFFLSPAWMSSVLGIFLFRVYIFGNGICVIHLISIAFQVHSNSFFKQFPQLWLWKWQITQITLIYTTLWPPTEIFHSLHYVFFESGALKQCLMIKYNAFVIELHIYIERDWKKSFQVMFTRSDLYRIELSSLYSFVLLFT